MTVAAGGQSGNTTSPHFADQAGRHAERRLRPVYFYPDDLEGMSCAATTWAANVSSRGPGASPSPAFHRRSFKLVLRPGVEVACIMALVKLAGWIAHDPVHHPATLDCRSRADQTGPA